jgi:hypothetical protein
MSKTMMGTRTSVDPADFPPSGGLVCSKIQVYGAKLVKTMADLPSGNLT